MNKNQYVNFSIRTKDVVRITAVTTFTCGLTIAVVKVVSKQFTGYLNEVNDKAKKKAEEMEKEKS